MQSIEVWSKQMQGLKKLRAAKSQALAQAAAMGFSTQDYTPEFREKLAEITRMITFLERQTRSTEGDTEDHISKSQFGKIVKARLDSLKNDGDPLELLSNEDDYPVKIMHQVNGAQIAKELGGIAFKTPFAKEFARSLQDDIQDATTIRYTIESIMRVIRTYDAATINQHYKENRTAYGKDTGEEDFLELFDTDLEIDFSTLESLKQSVLDAIVDPDYAPNKEKVTTDREKEQEKAAADYNTFAALVRDGRDKAIRALNQMGTDGKIRENMQVVDLVQLEQNSAMGVYALPYMEPYKDQLVQRLLDSLKRANTLLTIGQTKQIMIGELMNDAQVIDWKKVYEEYQQQGASNHSGNIYPTGFAAWINSSTTKVSSSGFEAALSTWTQNIRGSIGKRWAELDANKKAYNIKPKAFDKELKSLFSKPLDPIGSDLGSAVYLHIQKGFKSIEGKEKVSMKELDKAWLAGLDAANKDAIVKDLFRKNMLTKVKSEAEITICVENMDTYFPVDSMIWQAMDNARHYAKALPKPAMELAKDKATCTFHIAAASQRTQSMKLGFEVDLRFVPATTATGLNLYVPVPQASGKLVDITTSSYEVTLENVWVGQPAKNTTGEIPLSVATPITWKLNVRDTSEETVIQEAKKKAMKLLSANIGDIIPAANLKQVSGITDKILAGEVKLVGDEYGNISDIQVETTILSLPFVIGVGRNGFVAKLKNPLKPRELRQFSYGESQFTLYLTATAWADVAGGQCTVKIAEGKIGTAQGKYADKPVQLERLEEGKKAYAIPHLTQKKE